MSKVTYEVVQHDTGWAYKVGDVFSGTFATHEEAHAAAEAASQRQALASDPSLIEYEDANGNWHKEVSTGDDRPETAVEDSDETAGATPVDAE